MKAGILKDIIEIYEPKVVSTDYGDQKITYVYFYKTHACIQDTGGNRAEEANRIVFNNSKRFIVRYYVPIKETMRIKFDNKWWKINQIQSNKFYNDKEIDCELVNL